MLIDWFTVAAQAINFLLLVWLLKRFLYRPVLAAIDEREKGIAAQLKDVEKEKAAASQEQAAFLQKNEEFHRRRAQLLLEATTAAQEERKKLLETAHRDAEALRSKLQKSSYEELDRLGEKLGVLAQAEVFSTVRKALSDLAGASLEERMTDVFIQHLRDLPPAERSAFRVVPETSPPPVFVSSSFELTPSQKESIEHAVKDFLSRQISLHYEIKPDLIAGIELAANGRKIAWSLAGYLTALNQSVQNLLTPKSETAPDSTKALPHAV